MAEKPRRQKSRSRDRRIAVIDVGSNSIRLVIYTSLSRAPLMLFNEKVLCGLGRGIAKTGRLNPEGVVQAILNLVRFRTLVDAMGVRHVQVVATAAVREATNGADFVREVERRTGFKVTVLSGEDEGQISALGLLASIPDAEGVLGDLGGGSLELVNLSGTKIGKHLTLPIGPLRLIDTSGGNLAEAREQIDAALRSVSWLPQMEGRSFYAVGGAWRSIARVLMDYEQYPLHIIHHYTVDAEHALSFLGLVARMGKEQLRVLPTVSRRRLETLPWAALILERLLAIGKPSDLVFAASGLREGCVFAKLPKRVQKQDPLLTACSDIAGQRRFQLSDEELFGFIGPVLRVSALNRDGQAAQERLVRAACMLSDIAWSEHPDYRAEQAYWRVLRLPIVGITHAERAFLALAIAARYGAQADEMIDRAASALLNPSQIRLAAQLGAALRLSYTVSGGAPGVLSRSTLELKPDGRLALSVPDDGSVIVADAVSRRLETLARSLNAISVLLPEEAVAVA